MITPMDELKIIVPKVFEDERGYFLESYSEKTCEIDSVFVQDNESFSKKNVIRGMHFQPGQAKLVRCVHGDIFDVAVDVRPESPTFGCWKGFVLTGENKRQLFIPDGFAHGFAVLSEYAVVAYKVSSFYDPKSERGFRYNDPSIGIEWGIEHPIVSLRDRSAQLFGDVCAYG